MVAEPFVWGAGGAQLTPEQIAAQRKVAQAMLTQGADFSPIQHWSQGLSRVAQAIVGGMDTRDLDKAERGNAAAERELIASLIPGASSAPVAATPATAVSAPMGNLPAMSNTAGKIYGNDESSPLDPPSGADRDNAIRTVVAEAGNQGPTGMNAVASVIRNRAVNGGFGGDTPSGVVTAPNQFEPWNTAHGRGRMASLDPNSAAYQAAAGAVDQAYAGNDPTSGAMNFYAPKAQAALGRPAPAWDNGKGVDIGDHRFFGGAPAPVTRMAFAGPTESTGAIPANATPAQPSAPATAPAGPQAAPGVNPRILAAMVSPYVSDGTKKILGVMLQQQMKPQEFTYQTTPDGTILRMDPRGGAPVPVYQAQTKATFGVIGKDAFGNERYGFIDPVKQTTSAPQGATDASSPTLMGPDGKPIAIPAGQNPKVYRDEVSKRSVEESMPASSDASSKLRNEIQGLPSYKNLAQAAPVYKSMFEAAARDTRAADVNMIYGMAKIMDPGSVVRESEMTVAQAIATLPQQLRATVQSQLTGDGRLSPEVRASIMQEAQSRIGAYQAMFDQDAGMYRGIAQRGRMNEADVLPTFGPFESYKPATTAAPAAPKPAEGGWQDVGGVRIREKK